jgi:acyl-coenzyme A synthetase/AMP-(fatty) acid ligase
VSVAPHPLLPPEVQDDYRKRGYWEDRTLADIMADKVLAHPDRLAVTGSRRFTYAELWAESRRLAGSLREAGLQPGEFLVALLSSSWQGVVLELAAVIAGVAFVPRASNLGPIGTSSLMDQLGARSLVLQGDLAARPEWQEALPLLRERMRGRPLMVQGPVQAGSGFEDLPALESAAANGPEIDPVPLDPGAPCLVLSTGGTTGMPKSIIHCSNTLVFAARRFGAGTDYLESDVQVSFAPYGHAGGSVFDIYMPLYYSAAILPISRWQAQPVAEEISRYGGTFFITMGTHIFDLLKLGPEIDSMLAPVRLVTSGAGPDELYVEGEARFGFPIVRVYGCSEVPGHAIGRPSDPGELRWHRDGVPFEGLEYRVVDLDTGDPVAPGQPGEYQVRGPNLFMGYHGQPELTAQAVTPDGFYRSGDLLVESGDGYVTWAGRTKDIIRRGGLQLDPVEMENILAGAPEVHEVVVVGEPHPRLGEIAVIVAVAAPGATPTLENLCGRLLKQGIPKQNLPEKLVLTSGIPRTGVGKFHRAEVKSRLIEGRL